MLRSIKEILNYVLSAEDGEIGKCKDFLFDDEFWVIRYMVADTGKWLLGKKVLIYPIFLGDIDWSNHRICVNLTRDKIENAPLLNEHAPVSRRYEQQYLGYHHFPYYWIGPEMVGPGPYPPAMPLPPIKKETATDEDPEKSHLRSMQEVTDYHIKTEDGHVGHVADYIVDDASWVIRYIVVDTRNWLPGRKVLVAPHWIKSLEWPERRVTVNLTTTEVKESPEYDPTQPVNREYEARLYDYYGRPVYWK